MKQIVICHMTSAHKSNDNRIFQKECTYLAKNPKFSIYLVARGESRIENGVKVIGVGRDFVSRLSRITTVCKKIYKTALEVDADIYHFHDPELLPYALRLKSKGKIVIFDSHENTSVQISIKPYIPAVIRKIISKMYYKYETRVCKKIDAVIFPCPYIGKHPFSNRSKRCIYINNYPILQNNDSNSVNEKVTCCYIGSLSENRGVTVLLKAFKKLDVKLILAGEFESTEYYNILLKDKLLDDVDYRGYCSTSEVNEILEESCIGISNILNIGQYPLIDTFPTKVYEYMNAGLAVIVSDYNFSNKIVNQYKLGVTIAPDKEQELINAVNFMKENMSLTKRMGENGKKLIKTSFNWNIEVNKLVNLYCQCFDNK